MVGTVSQWLGRSNRSVECFQMAIFRNCQGCGDVLVMDLGIIVAEFCGCSNVRHATLSFIHGSNDCFASTCSTVTGENLLILK